MQLREYAVVVYRRWWVAVVAAVVALTTAYLLARAQAPVYRSSIALEVTGRIDYGQILAMDKLLRQISSRISTSGVAEDVDRRLQLDLGVDALLAKIHTQAFSDTMQIRVDVDDVDPLRAERIARVLGTVVEERQAAQMARLPQQERVILSVLDRPSAARFVWPATRSILLAAGLLGLLVGVFLTFVLDYLDDTIKSAEEAERYLNLPVLGTLPGVRNSDAGARRVAWIGPHRYRPATAEAQPLENR